MLKLGKVLREKECLKKGQLVEILKLYAGRITVRALNDTKEVEMGRALVKVICGEEDITLRMKKEADFDQECGCTAVVEFKELKQEAFNVYGDFEKYLEEGERAATDLTPHYRREHLKIKGWVRSRGLKAFIRDPRSRIRKYERNGYEAV